MKSLSIRYKLIVCLLHTLQVSHSWDFAQNHRRTPFIGDFQNVNEEVIFQKLYCNMTSDEKTGATVEQLSTCCATDLAQVSGLQVQAINGKGALVVFWPSIANEAIAGYWLECNGCEDFQCSIPSSRYGV